MIRKIADILFKVLNTLTTIILALLLLTTLYQRISGQMPGFLGYHIMYVLTGSMEPEIMTNDAVIVKDIDGKDVKVGDVVCYIAEEGQIKGNTIIHKVYKDVYEENGQLFLVTKGVANAVEDDPIHVESVFGMVVLKVPFLGSVIAFFRTVPGLIVLLSPIVYCIVKEIIEISKVLKEK